MSTGSWERLVAEARQHRDETVAQIDPPIPDLSDLIGATLPRNVTGIPRSVLSPAEVTMTETPIEELLAQLSSGRLTAVDAMRAFLRRAGIAQKLVNCVLEIAPQEAVQRAEELDAFYKMHQHVVGPLHGLPVSLKAMLPWQGRKTTGSGIVAELDCETDYTARNEMDAWVHRFFDSAEQAGAPVCLQLIGKRLEDEMLVQIMNEIVEAVALPFVDCLRQQ